MFLKQLEFIQLLVNGLVNPVTAEFERKSEFNSPYKKYKYIGKENIEGKEYIKCSLTSDNNLERTCYYIDIQDKTIAKIEYYTNYENEFELQSTTNYTYSYNTVTDEDVAKFDVNQYSDYKYIEE